MRILGLALSLGVSWLLLPVAGCGGDKPAADPPAQSGLTLASQDCAHCHDPGDGSYSGQATSVVADKMIFPPNLTPDKDTGIGGWSEDQIEHAIRGGVANDGTSLCNIMPRFNHFTDEEVSRIVRFLRALPPVNKTIPNTVCN
jgi:mono/diheme cytochrome c family protein